MYVCVYIYISTVCMYVFICVHVCVYVKRNLSARKGKVTNEYTGNTDQNTEVVNYFGTVATR